ncbi:MAG: PPOX class F420-dependent oxidoreductase [Anaerolinea sp.]|nr:PPOX class F420-dependent oxidoreductase [Anaerolinea sp.]
MTAIPSTHLDLLTDEKRAFVYLATLMADGSPQVTPVWFNTDGEYILVNSAKGRVKDRNMRARPTVALCIADPANPYRYLQIHGKVIEFTTEGADAHIDALAFKYQGVPKYPYRQPGEIRVIYKIQAEKVDAHG